MWLVSCTNNVENCIAIVARKWYSYQVGGMIMNKTISISIRVSESDLSKLKKAAEIELYSSYSEFIRRTSLKEADKIIESDKLKAANYMREGLDG